jgi:serine/threonine-protein kinase
MGVVYRGADITSSQAVAIKTLQSSAFHSPKTRERFQREATLANRLNHPGIARVLDFGVEDDTPFLIMELVDGVELSEVIEKEAPLPPARVIVIMRQLVAALGEAHAHNMVHRDIKPDNLKLSGYSAGGPIVLKVLDFGLAKEIGEEQRKLTTTGAVIGTPLYLAPELAMDATPVIDGRTDQYSAGILFYELLTGHTPFNSPSVGALLISHMAKPPPPLPKEVPEPLRRIVMRMLSKTQADRFPDDEAIDRALSACEKACASAPAAKRSLGRTSATSPVGLARATIPARRSVKIGAAVGLIVILAVCGTILKGQRAISLTRTSSIPESAALPAPAVPSTAATSTATPPTDGGVSRIAEGSDAQRGPLAPSAGVRHPSAGRAGAAKKGSGKKAAQNAQLPPPNNPYVVPVAR